MEQLHKYISEDLQAYNFDDGVNKISTFFYQTDEIFTKIYHQFVVELLENEIFQMPLWFQATPTIRIYCPNARNSNHYPRYHTDVSYGHLPEEINLWLPLIEVMEGHGFRKCSLDNSQQILETVDYDFGPFIDKAIHDPLLLTFVIIYHDPPQRHLGKYYYLIHVVFIPASL